MKKLFVLIITMMISVAAQAADKWANQCAFSPKVVQAYDDTGSAPTTKIKNGAYYVTHTNPTMVGLSVETSNFDPKTQGPEKKFMGWVKKSDMKIIDYRNCSM